MAILTDQLTKANCSVVWIINVLGNGSLSTAERLIITAIELNRPNCSQFKWHEHWLKQIINKFACLLSLISVVYTSRLCPTISDPVRLPFAKSCSAKAFSPVWYAHQTCTICNYDISLCKLNFIMNNKSASGKLTSIIHDKWIKSITT